MGTSTSMQCEDGTMMVGGPIGTHVVMVEAYLDVRNVGAVRTQLNDALAVGTGDVVLDLTGLDSIDATGLGMLTAIHLRCERAGVRLLLSNCPREIRRLLAVTRLNRILHVDRAQLRLSV